MKNLKFLTLAIAILGFTATSFAQNPTASDVAAASATIVAPITIEKKTDLMFGNIIASTAIGTVTVGIANTRARTGGATFPNLVGTVSSAEFTVAGLEGATYNVSLPGDNAIKLEGGGQDMYLTGFTHNANETIANSITNNTFQVGATLNVNANQVAGEYKGNFNVTVNYN